MEQKEFEKQRKKDNWTIFKTTFVAEYKESERKSGLKSFLIDVAVFAIGFYIADIMIDLLNITSIWLECIVTIVVLCIFDLIIRNIVALIKTLKSRG